MVKVKSQYICQQCGYSQSQWAGKCPNCGEWNSLVETLLKTEKASLSKKRSEGKSSTVKVSEVQISLVARKSTGDGELDNVLGGGVVGGMGALVGKVKDIELVQRQNVIKELVVSHGLFGKQMVPGELIAKVGHNIFLNVTRLELATMLQKDVKK